MYVQYDGEMSSHGYAPPPPIDGISSPVYDPTATGHHGRVSATSLPLQPSAGAALPRSPTYSPHTAAVSSMASPYSAGAAGNAPGYASAAAAMNSSSSAAAVAAVDSLLKRDKDAIYRQAHNTLLQLSVDINSASLLSSNSTLRKSQQMAKFGEGRIESPPLPLTLGIRTPV